MGGESALSGGEPAAFLLCREVTALHVWVMTGGWAVARRGGWLWELLGHVSAMWPCHSAQGGPFKLCRYCFDASRFACAEFSQVDFGPNGTPPANLHAKGQAVAEPASKRDYSWCPHEDAAVGLAMYRASSIEGCTTNRHRLVAAKKEYNEALDLVVGEHRPWEQAPKPQRPCPTVEQSKALRFASVPDDMGGWPPEPPAGAKRKKKAKDHPLTLRYNSLRAAGVKYTASYQTWWNINEGKGPSGQTDALLYVRKEAWKEDVVKKSKDKKRRARKQAKNKSNTGDVPGASEVPPWTENPSSSDARVAPCIGGAAPRREV